MCALEDGRAAPREASEGAEVLKRAVLKYKVRVVAQPRWWAFKPTQGRRWGLGRDVSVQAALEKQARYCRARPFSDRKRSRSRTCKPLSTNGVRST